MNMTIDLTQIILAIITLIGALIARYLIPLIKEKTDEKSYAMFQTAVSVAVYAAEQLYTSKQGQEKKEYVLQVLAAQGYDVDMEAVEAQIEATVRELRLEFGKKEEEA